MTSYPQNLKSPPYEVVRIWVLSHYYLIVRYTLIPRWRQRCWRASHELCSHYLQTKLVAIINLTQIDLM